MKSDGPYTLSQILTKEYIELGILEEKTEAELLDLKDAFDKQHGVMPFKVAELSSPEERLHQRQLRAERHAMLLGELRRRLNQGRTEENLPTALCLSGGGIRSATFCLGVLQSLAKHKLLGKFHYLSTVSGGGYIGSWLSAWATRDDISSIEDKLSCKGLAPGLVEPPELTYLRTYSNYMSPRVGLLSTDSWTLISTYLRNLLLNWTVFVPLILALLLLPKIFDAFLPVAAAYDSLLSVKPYVTRFALLGVISAMLAVAMMNLMRPSIKDYTFAFLRQAYWIDEIGSLRSSNWSVFWTALLLVISAIFITFFIVGMDADRGDQSYMFPMIGAAIFVGGYLLSSVPTSFKRLASGKNQLKWTKIAWHFWVELFFSLICGTIGGFILEWLLSTANDYVGQLAIFVFGDKAVNRFGFMGIVGVPEVLLTFMLSATLFIGLASRITNDDDREWSARLGAILLKITAGWLIVFAAVTIGAELYNEHISYRGQSTLPIGVILSAVISVVSGFTSRTPASGKDRKRGWSSYLLVLLTSVIAPIAIFILFIFFSYLSEIVIADLPIPGLDRLPGLVLWLGVLVVIGMVMGSCVNINKFSFHSIYRDRLIRAYLGASNRDRIFQANSFTGLNTEDDNIEMQCLKHKPLHVINIALNLVRAKNLAWQNRKAESFTVTKFHSGSSCMGQSGNYRSSAHYGYSKENNKAITLGTAAAISGAAVSPNMGYFTMGTAVSFLMVLLNVRLGWWLGNPGQRGRRTWDKATPNFSPYPFSLEALDLTDDEHAYVYLADGGQFENLGLYEMVLRRCKLIVVCDAGSDPNYGFFDLGSAIHKIRVDMGIQIRFESDVKPKKGRNCAIAKIEYSSVDGPGQDGTLIYIKPTLDGTESIDIAQYKKENPQFPHETTADQMYSESQFESYRKLGFSMMESICASNPKSISDIENGATAYRNARSK